MSLVRSLLGMVVGGGINTNNQVTGLKQFEKREKRRRIFWE